MRDPVTGFTYPPAWEQDCGSVELLQLVRQGLAVLTVSGTILRRGFTTGTTAAAACKAAILSLQHPVDSVDVKIPCGLTLSVPVAAVEGRASCRKFAGEYLMDITSNLEFIATAVPAPSGVRFVPGDGVGNFSHDTPRYRKGMPAISPPSLSCILTAIDEALQVTGISGIFVTLTVPDGSRIAKKTLNSRVGVDDGISILGTTGLVEPWDDHLEESVLDRVAHAKDPLLVTGRIGLRYARLFFPAKEIILVGGKIGQALAAVRGDAILFGLPGLILRYINPAILDGTGYMTVEEYAAAPEFTSVLQENLVGFGQRYRNIRVIIIGRDGTILGESP